MDMEKVVERIHEAIDIGVCVDLFMDVLELLKEQDETIKQQQAEMEEINFGDVMAAEITTPCIVCGESIHIGECESYLVPRICKKCKKVILMERRRMEAVKALIDWKCDLPKGN